MDKLKDFIDNNREAFEDEWLPEGHFERFEQKLPTESGKKHKRHYLLWCSYAAVAVVALLLLLQLPGGSTMPNSEQKATAQASQAKEEIDELQIYYRMQINDLMAQMEHLYKQQQTPGATELLKETKKILQDNYMFEETVLPVLPHSNDGVFAMTQHYNGSLESLNFMLKQMERITNENNK